MFATSDDDADGPSLCFSLCSTLAAVQSVLKKRAAEDTAAANAEKKAKTAAAAATTTTTTITAPPPFRVRTSAMSAYSSMLGMGGRAKASHPSPLDTLAPVTVNLPGGPLLPQLQLMGGAALGKLWFGDNSVLKTLFGGFLNEKSSTLLLHAEFSVFP